jgi:cell division septal protein FtsQ
VAVKAPAERNFRRARAKPARRSRFRPHLSWTAARRLLSVLLLVFGVYQTVSLAFTTPLLRVRRIAVQGNVRLSSGQVHALVEDLRGTSMLTADLEAFRSRLSESPWVADVALRRVLPSTIEVFISERRPVGLCRLGQDLYLVDESGTLIDQFGPQYAEFDLPIIDGLVNAPNTRGAMHGPIDPQKAGLAARVIASLGRDREIARRLSQVDVADVNDAVVLLEGDSALLHLGGDKFLERVQGYLDLSSTLRARVAEIDYVDLRFDQRVYVGPLPRARGTHQGNGGRRPRGSAW